ncbi:MAG: hypothetical protein ACYDEN_06220 [Acidimicrobiales bacterium]
MMDTMELLEQLGRVEPAAPEVLDRTAGALLALAGAEERPTATATEGTGRVAQLLRPTGTNRRCASPPAWHTDGSPRRRWGAGAAVATAAAVAVVVVLVGTNAIGGGNARPRLISARTVAYRAIAALDRTSGARIEYVHTVSDSGTFNQWSYGDSTHGQILDANGTLMFDGSATVSNGATTSLTVNYANHTWTVVSGKASPWAGHDESSLIRHELAVGRLRLIGYPIVNGHRTLEVFGTFSSMPAGAAALTVPSLGAASIAKPSLNNGGGGPAAVRAALRAAGVLPLTLTLWIDPSTYLPVQSVATGANGKTLSTSTILWLTPDTGNLAQLHASIPPGFTHVPSQGH